MGCTASYRRLRNGIRDFYRRNYPLTAGARDREHLNPGDGLVSRLCHEPRVALAVLEEMLAPYRSGRRLRVLLCHRPVAAEMRRGSHHGGYPSRRGDRRTADRHTPATSSTRRRLGDLLRAGRRRARGRGREPGRDRRAPRAAGRPEPLDQQAVSWCFPLDYMPGEDHTIDRPDEYDFWRDYRASFWPGPQLSWTDVYPDTLTAPPPRDLPRGALLRWRDGSDLWHYRRILARENFSEGLLDSDITLVNWPQIDYWLGPLVGVGEAERHEHLQRRAAAQPLAALLDADRGAPARRRHGYRGLRLRPDIVGTQRRPRQARLRPREPPHQGRVHGLEQHVGVERARRVEGSAVLPRQRRHRRLPHRPAPQHRRRNYVDVEQLAVPDPARRADPGARQRTCCRHARTSASTHITNGCYRLHPVEWNIGEAAGALAAYCLDKDLLPRQVRDRAESLEDFQRLLVDVLGFELAWPEPQRYESL